MKKIIILEGPDNIGKTHLTKFLTEGYSAVSRHFGPPKGDGKKALNAQLSLLEQTLCEAKQGEGIEIWDRSVIGESVYGPLYRHYDHEKYAEQLKKSLHEIKKQIFFIVFYADKHTYPKFNLTPKKDEKVTYQTQAEAERISVKFVDVATWLNLPHTLYVNCNNYASLDKRNDYVCNRIRHWVNRRAYVHNMKHDYSHTFFNAAQRIWHPGEGFVQMKYLCESYKREICDIGNDHKELALFGQQHNQPTSGCGAVKNIKYIFVGEAPGKDGCGKLGIPFYDDVSGNLFQSALDSLHIFPTQYYLTNVVKCNPKENKLADYVNNITRPKLECVKKLEKEIRVIQDKNPDAKLISLGKVANEELVRMKFDCEMLYHPAYYCRLGQSERFCMDLKEIVGCI